MYKQKGVYSIPIPVIIYVFIISSVYLLVSKWCAWSIKNFDSNSNLSNCVFYDFYFTLP